MFQIEQVLTNDCLRVWNAFWNICSPTFINWKLLTTKILQLVFTVRQKSIEISNKLHSSIMRKFLRYYFHMWRTAEFAHLRDSTLQYSLYLRGKKRSRKYVQLKFPQFNTTLDKKIWKKVESRCLTFNLTRKVWKLSSKSIPPSVSKLERLWKYLRINIFIVPLLGKFLHMHFNLYNMRAW